MSFGKIQIIHKNNTLSEFGTQTKCTLIILKKIKKLL